MLYEVITTERHQGMISALVAECIVKLVAFLILGFFTTYTLFDGPADLLARMRDRDLLYLLQLHNGANSGVEWLTLIALGFGAIFCLPRQFHVSYNFV